MKVNAWRLLFNTERMQQKPASNSIVEPYYSVNLFLPPIVWTRSLSHDLTSSF